MPQPLPSPGAATPEAIAFSRGIIEASIPFARANDGLAAWQIGSILALFGGSLGLLHVYGDQPWRWLLILPLTAVLIRIFVLQHDCGHKSLFRSSRVNDAVGTLLGFITGVAYEAWRSEHNWHHGNQAKLSHRGVDRMNSPMTAAEAIANPANAKLRRDKISIPSIFFLGAVSLVILRKRHTAFFQFRERFRWTVRNGPAMIRSVRLTNGMHLAYLVALAVWLGPLNFIIALMAMVSAAGCGSLLFWVQHNYEHSHQADDAHWSFIDAGVYGSSYIHLGPLWRYITASICLHHVHHVNARIPNYRLEAARRAIPELAAVASLQASDLRKCFTHVFWDEGSGRMVPHDEVFADRSAGQA
ncbi:MAG: fatty acid desaturase [Candidatus Sericytochromatia bacterium]|nr:fatty acid desaturase [Candidatus Sericytochromatia bacterium]